MDAASYVMRRLVNFSSGSFDVGFLDGLRAR